MKRDDSRTFLISVAAQLAGMHAQTLRTYDRLGLVRPQRSTGGGRRYSWRDIELLREVVPALVRLVEGELPSGRHRAEDLLAVGGPARIGTEPVVAAQGADPVTPSWPGLIHQRG